jgi:hypothetical protein
MSAAGAEEGSQGQACGDASMSAAGAEEGSQGQARSALPLVAWTKNGCALEGRKNTRGITDRIRWLRVRASPNTPLQTFAVGDAPPDSERKT